MYRPSFSCALTAAGSRFASLVERPSGIASIIFEVVAVFLIRSFGIGFRRIGLFAHLFFETCAGLAVCTVGHKKWVRKTDRKKKARLFTAMVPPKAKQMHACATAKGVCEYLLQEWLEQRFFRGSVSGELRNGCHKESLDKEYLHLYEKSLLALPGFACSRDYSCRCLWTSFLRMGQRGLLLFWRGGFASFFPVSGSSKRLAAKETNRNRFSLSFGIGSFVVCGVCAGRVSHHVPVVLKCVGEHKCVLLSGIPLVVVCTGKKQHPYFSKK